MFPISRDPPEGGTWASRISSLVVGFGFQFLGIPPKGEPPTASQVLSARKGFQFLGIPPKGELLLPEPPVPIIKTVSNF